jgi:hypothetical protein
VGISSGSLAEDEVSGLTTFAWHRFSFQFLTKFFIAVVTINAIYFVTRFVERLAVSGVTSWFYGTLVNRFSGGVVIVQEFVTLVSTILCIIRYLLTTRRDSYIRRRRASWCRDTGGGVRLAALARSRRRAIIVFRRLARVDRLQWGWLWKKSGFI